MDQCEDREEGVPPSKTTLCGEHESQTKAQRNQLEPEPKPKPEPSRVSYKRIPVKDLICRFEHLSSDKKIHQRLKPGPGPSCVSLKSDRSAGRFIDFKGQQASATERLEPAGDQLVRTGGLRKYSCELTIDTNTVNKWLRLSDNNRKVTYVLEDQSYPDHPDRFDWFQLLCRNGLTGRCYWEVEWRGYVDISVSYRRIRRKGGSGDCVFGRNHLSWSLNCSNDGPQSVWGSNRKTSISSSSVSNRVAVYVDVPAGTLSFYRVSSDTLIHLHTFNTTFTEALYPGFTICSPGSSVALC